MTSGLYSKQFITGIGAEHEGSLRSEFALLENALELSIKALYFRAVLDLYSSFSSFLFATLSSAQGLLLADQAQCSLLTVLREPYIVLGIKPFCK